MELEFLKEKNELAKNIIGSALEKIKEASQRQFYLNFLSLNNVTLATSSIYIEKDYEAAKKYFYKAAMCDAYMFIYYDQLMHASIFSICYAALSDNEKVISLYKNLKNDSVDTKFFGYHFNSSFQAVISNDLQLLEQQLAHLKKQTLKKTYRSYQGYVFAFKGLLERNKNKVELGLDELIKTHKKREGQELIKKFISIDATALAKLAWRIGMEVKVNSSFIPIELLPVEELSRYESYDFFNEVINPEFEN